MKFFKRNVRTIIGFLVGVILASSITVYAYSYLASEVSYSKPGTNATISVSDALNDLYDKINIKQENNKQQLSYVGVYSGTNSENTKTTSVAVQNLTVGKSYLFICYRAYTGGANAYTKTNTNVFTCSFTNVSSFKFLNEAVNSYVVTPSNTSVTVKFSAFSTSKYPGYGAAPYVYVFEIE